MSIREKHGKEMAFHCDYKRLVQIKAANDYLKVKDIEKDNLERSLKKDIFEFIFIFVSLIVIVAGISFLENERKLDKKITAVQEQKINE